MLRIICFAIMATGLFMSKIYAQVPPPVTPKLSPGFVEYLNPSDNEEYRKELIEGMERQKDSVASEEKYKLKQALVTIDKQLEEAKIDAAKAQELKEAAAKIAALNIDNKTAIIQNKIELVKRGENFDYGKYQGTTLELGFGNAYDERGSFLLGLHYRSNRPIKYDKRTGYNMIFAFGFNNTIGGGKTIGDEYTFGKSNYSEIGVALRTRLLKNSNMFRLVYGLSYQQNTFTPKNNRYFVDNNGTTELQHFDYQLKKKSYFRLDNLVVPVHLEMGPSKRKEYKDYFRYDTSDSFRVGIGGYVGYNLGAVQRLQYKVDGEKRIDKLHADYNVNRFLYGVSTYIGFGPLSLYARYELNTVFKNGFANDHNISFAIRADL